jgi:hypothetical protein
MKVKLFAKKFMELESQFRPRNKFSHDQVIDQLVSVVEQADIEIMNARIGMYIGCSLSIILSVILLVR